MTKSKYYLSNIINPGCYIPRKPGIVWEYLIYLKNIWYDSSSPKNSCFCILFI